MSDDQFNCLEFLRYEQKLANRRGFPGIAEGLGRCAEELILYDARCSAIRERRAVDYADSLGIYAVPFVHHASKGIYWRPRMRNGKDPDPVWEMNARPTHTGWPSWADAVIALGDFLACEQEA